MYECDHSVTRNFRVEFVHEKTFRDLGSGLKGRSVARCPRPYDKIAATVNKKKTKR